VVERRVAVVIVPIAAVQRDKELPRLDINNCYRIMQQYSYADGTIP
jgi:hypothetical protein